MDRLASYHKPTFVSREGDGTAEHLLFFTFRGGRQLAGSVACAAANQPPPLRKD
jgi:hypothetical protein